MNVSLFQAAAALDGNLQWQQMIAQNLAASSVPAFKRSDISFHTIQAGVLGAGSNDLISQGIPTLLPSPTIATTFQQGTLQPTGDKTDMALQGPGFFKIQQPDGSIVYTRDGGIKLNKDGQMLDKHGNAFLSEVDAPIELDPKRPLDIKITEAADVSQGGPPIGTLGIVEFQDPTQLQPIGGGYFKALPGAQPVPSTLMTTTVHHETSEQANVVPTKEVSTLLLALRHYEANQKVIQMHDERMGRMIQELSATS